MSLFNLLNKEYARLNAKLDQLIKMWKLYIAWCKKFDELFNDQLKKVETSKK